MAESPDLNYTLVDEVMLELRPGGTTKFVGSTYGSEASFFHVKNKPGQGASLHVHPYPETWIVLRGRVRFTVGDEATETDAGHFVVARENIPHKFSCIGPEDLEMVCIHPSPEILQTDLVDEAETC